MIATGRPFIVMRQYHKIRPTVPPLVFLCRIGTRHPGARNDRRSATRAVSGAIVPFGPTSRGREATDRTGAVCRAPKCTASSVSLARPPRTLSMRGNGPLGVTAAGVALWEAVTEESASRCADR